MVERSPYGSPAVKAGLASPLHYWEIEGRRTWSIHHTLNFQFHSMPQWWKCKSIPIHISKWNHPKYTNSMTTLSWLLKRAPWRGVACWRTHTHPSIPSLSEEPTCTRIASLPQLQQRQDREEGLPAKQALTNPCPHSILSLQAGERGKLPIRIYTCMQCIQMTHHASIW